MKNLFLNASFIVVVISGVAMMMPQKAKAKVLPVYDFSIPLCNDGPTRCAYDTASGNEWHKGNKTVVK